MTEFLHPNHHIHRISLSLCVLFFVLLLFVCLLTVITLESDESALDTQALIKGPLLLLQTDKTGPDDVTIQLFTLFFLFFFAKIWYTPGQQMLGRRKNEMPSERLMRRPGAPLSAHLHLRRKTALGLVFIPLFVVSVCLEHPKKPCEQCQLLHRLAIDATMFIIDFLRPADAVGNWLHAV